VLDNLNTHCSESYVRFVAEQCGIDTASFGGKGISGIQKYRHTRQAFLRDPLHRIHFYSLPNRTSWMNQVEIWFGVVRRKVTRFGNFVFLEILRNKLRQSWTTITMYLLTHTHGHIEVRHDAFTWFANNAKGIRMVLWNLQSDHPGVQKVIRIPKRRLAFLQLDPRRN
jgi:hypothetical protein